MNTKKAFTLVELIVVITIVAILWTLGFLSSKDVIKKARNSARVSDLSSMKQALSITFTRDNRYPSPDSSVNISYSWAIMWKQWVFWKNVHSAASTISKIPLDPSFKIPYSYSVLENGSKYELLTILEAWLLLSKPITQTYALLEDKTTYNVWNYKHYDTLAKNGSQCYLISAPSLHITNINTNSSLTHVDDYNFSFNKSLNIPNIYSGSVSPLTSGTIFNVSQTLNKCNIWSIWEMSRYVSNLSESYQQLSNIKKYWELIFDSQGRKFMSDTIYGLEERWITVDEDVVNSIKNNNFFNDNFTDSDNSLVNDHSSIDGWWLNIWNASDLWDYWIRSNVLEKLSSNNTIISPNPFIPLSSPNTNSLFKINNFAWWNIVIYNRYTDSNNHYRLELNSAWYSIISRVWWVDTNLQNIADPIANDSYIEFSVIWDNIKLYINNIQKENLVDLSIWAQGITGFLIQNTWASIDDYSLIYN